MRNLGLVLAFLLSAAPMRAQQISTTIVPIVGSTFGQGMARWLTDVELVNTTSTDLDVAIELPAAPQAPLLAFTLSPGQSQRFTDIVGQAFGLESAMSPLRVTTGGRVPVLVRAAVYAVDGEGHVSPLQPVAVYGDQWWFPVRVLDGLAFSDDTRTNIGLVNFGSAPADFVLALQRVPGRNVALTTIRIAPGSFLHTAIQTLFPLIAKGYGFSVVVETDARDTHVYASVVENATNAGRFIVPRIGAR